MGFIKTIFNANEREIKGFQRIVEKINALEPDMQKLTDEQLRAKTDEFRNRLANGETTDDLLVEAFAVVREAGVRTLGPKKARHFDAQMIGAMVLHQGRIAEMRTGEGKTLTATLPLYLNALEGKGAHLVTVNDYLARRDASWYGPIYHFLGLSIGSIHGQSAETGESKGSYIYDPEYVPAENETNQMPYLRPITRSEAYLCDITYGTNSEYGFDYLYDNMSFARDQLVQRELHYAIVDEVDSILIDEARTPLIISGQTDESTDLYYRMSRLIARLVNERDYTVEEKTRTVVLTDDGMRHVEEGLSVSNLSDPENLELMQHANAALKAKALFRKDVDYVVKEGQIIIVDEFTGRLMFGRRYSDGLHQAIEAKENVQIQHESQTLATITYQNYFRMYKKLAGMTGTALTEENEFRKIYALDVVEIPTNLPMVRQDHQDVIYKTEESKFRGLSLEVLSTYARQQPVLVGTRSIEVSERVSERLISERLQLLAATIILRKKLEESKEVDGETRKRYQQLLNAPFEDLTVPKFSGLAKLVHANTDMLSSENIDTLAKMIDVDEEGKEHLRYALKEGIPHNVLNAKYHEMEAQIISEAGRKGAITIATNMAGRGVDIVLGGPSDISGDRSPEAFDVVARGGLHIVGSERHESRRIDNQLRGRSGRQGDPGSSRFFVSLEDYLWRAFGDKSKSMLLNTWQEDMAMDHKLLSMAVERAQKKVEARDFEIRKHVLEYDDVMNVQRETIYGQRRKILDGAELRPTIMEYMHNAVTSGAESFCSRNLHPSEWDTKGLFDALSEVFPLFIYARPQDLADKKNLEEIEDFLHAVADRTYEDREKEIGEELMRDIERHVALQVINDKWIYHLDAMDFLREGIGLRGYAQQDPLVAYKKEAFEMFAQMMEEIQADMVRMMFTVKVQQPQAQRRRFHVLAESAADGGEQPRKASASGKISSRKAGKVGRNDPCPCGSGKKYKLCCLSKEEVV